MYFIVWTISQRPKPFIKMADTLNALASAVDRIKKRGQSSTIKIYDGALRNYNFSYQNKTKTVVEQIPNISFV